MRAHTSSAHPLTLLLLRHDSDKATVQFNSTRRDSHTPFSVHRFTVTVKGTGEVISLADKDAGGALDV